MCDIGAVSGDFTVTETSPPARLLQAGLGAPTPIHRLIRADQTPMPAEGVRALNGVHDKDERGRAHRARSGPGGSSIASGCVSELSRGYGVG